MKGKKELLLTLQQNVQTRGTHLAAFKARKDAWLKNKLNLM